MAIYIKCKYNSKILLKFFEPLNMGNSWDFNKKCKKTHMFLRLQFLLLLPQILTVSHDQGLKKKGKNE